MLAHAHAAARTLAVATGAMSTWPTWATLHTTAPVCERAHAHAFTCAGRQRAAHRNCRPGQSGERGVAMRGGTHAGWGRRGRRSGGQGQGSPVAGASDTGARGVGLGPTACAGRARASTYGVLPVMVWQEDSRTLLCESYCRSERARICTAPATKPPRAGPGQPLTHSHLKMLQVATLYLLASFVLHDFPW